MNMMRMILVVYVLEKLILHLRLRLQDRILLIWMRMKKRCLLKPELDWLILKVRYHCKDVV